MTPLDYKAQKDRIQKMAVCNEIKDQISSMQSDIVAAKEKLQGKLTASQAVAFRKFEQDLQRIQHKLYKVMSDELQSSFAATGLQLYGQQKPMIW